MKLSSPYRSIIASLGLLAAIAYFPSCGSPTTTADGACTSTTDCDSGLVCFEEQCTQQCSQSSDCDAGNQGCVDGVCKNLDLVECSAPADCITPNQCEISEGALCVAGECIYAPSGDCCATPSDCADSYSAAATCSDTSTATNCQGTRLNATCVNELACGSETIDDDSACAGLEHVCPNNYKSVFCGSGSEQSAPACASACTFSSDCAPGYICEGISCVFPAGAGESCTGSGQGTCGSTSLKCENGICCDANAGTCCDDSADCSGNLACSTTTSVCHSTCNDGDSARCADAANNVCSSNACVPSQVGAGDPCTNPSDCISGYCADGVCCQTACDGPCENCNQTTGVCDVMPADDTACGDIDCDFLDTTCRNYQDLSAARCATVGNCKTSILSDCAGFIDAADTVECRGAAGVCDAIEYCDGAGSCPTADLKQDTDYICRGSVDGYAVCDPIETCNGTSNTCPTDVLGNSGVKCEFDSCLRCNSTGYCNQGCGGGQQCICGFCLASGSACP